MHPIYFENIITISNKSKERVVKEKVII